MCYTQPAASDYDDWATVHNNPGWSFKDLLPLIQKVRNVYCSAVHDYYPDSTGHRPRLTRSHQASRCMDTMDLSRFPTAVRELT